MVRLPIPGSDSGQWGDILNNYLSQSHTSDGKLKTDSVTAAQLAAGAVKTAAIADSTITTTKLADGTVTTSKLADSAITNAKLDAPTKASLAKADSAVQDSDPRLTDARTPTAHPHTASEISDATTVGRSLITATDVASAQDVLSLSSTYAPIPTGTPDGTKFYKDNGTWAVPVGGAGGSGAPYLLLGTDNLQTILDGGERLIELDPLTTYSFNGITVPTGTRIYGNGATITSPNTTAPILAATIASNIELHDVIFKGATASPDNLAMVATDIGVKLTQAKSIHITGCKFQKFLGAGVSTSGYTGTLFDADIAVERCQFYYCYVGFANWNRSEYGVFTNNTLSYCRVGIWSQSGNWSYSGNTVAKCRAAFVSTLATNTLVTVAGGNPGHGSVVGNILNHCDATQTPGWATSNYEVEGIDYQGTHFDGASTCLPPTFTGNTLYFTDLTYTNSAASGMPQWSLAGCVLSTMTVSTDVWGSLLLSGCSIRSDVTLVNVPDGNSGPLRTVVNTASTAIDAATADHGKLFRLTASTAVTITLPAGAAVGTQIEYQSTTVAGLATFALGSGAAWGPAPTPSASMRAQGSAVAAVCVAVNTWTATGDLATA